MFIALFSYAGRDSIMSIIDAALLYGELRCRRVWAPPPPPHSNVKGVACLFPFSRERGTRYFWPFVSGRYSIPEKNLKILYF